MPILLGNVELSNGSQIIVPYGLLGYFALFLFIDIYFKNGKSRELFKTMMVLMTVLVFMNFILTPDFRISNFAIEFSDTLDTGYTLGREWLFGHRNRIFINHLVWILSTGIYYYLINKDYKKMFTLQVLFTFLVSIFSWNSTMMMCTVILYILYIFRNKKLTNASIIRYSMVYVILEVSIVFLRVQHYFEYFITTVLKRNLSFTGRTDIWDYYINQFLNGDIMNYLFGNFGNTTYGINSHNMFLGLLSFTGIVGIILFLSLYIKALVMLNKEKKDDVSKFITIILFAFLVNSLMMEFYLQPLLVLFLGYNVKELIKEREHYIKNTVI